MPNHPLYSPYMGAMWDFSECMIAMHRTREAELDAYVEAIRRQNEQVEELNDLQLAQALQIQDLEMQLVDEQEHSAILDQQVVDLNAWNAQLEAQVENLQANLDHVWQQYEESEDNVIELQDEIAHIQAAHPHQWGPDPLEELVLAHDDLDGCE
jgi:chromosome segregation ATPase